MGEESVSQKEREIAAMMEAEAAKAQGDAAQAAAQTEAQQKPGGSGAAPKPSPPRDAKKAAAEQAKPATFSGLEAKGSGPAAASPNLEFILDIPLQVTVELGRTRMLIHDLLQLGQGSVIELEKLAGEPMEVYVNDKLVARGEVVVVNEKFGVRLTDVVSPVERIKQLG